MTKANGPIGEPIGLYDSATGDIIMCNHCIDLSGMFPKVKEVVVRYADAKRGRIAQLCDLY